MTAALRFGAFPALPQELGICLRAAAGRSAQPLVLRIAVRLRAGVETGAGPAPIIGVVDRLSRKGGREVVARCPSRADAEEAGSWLVDRLSRLAPDLAVSTATEPGGGQFLLALRVD